MQGVSKSMVGKFALIFYGFLPGLITCNVTDCGVLVCPGVEEGVGMVIQPGSHPLMTSADVRPN